MEDPSSTAFQNIMLNGANITPTLEVPHVLLMSFGR
jgi:hypothetical protein